MSDRMIASEAIRVMLDQFPALKPAQIRRLLEERGYTLDTNLITQVRHRHRKRPQPATPPPADERLTRIFSRVLEDRPNLRRSLIAAEKSHLIDSPHLLELERDISGLGEVSAYWVIVRGLFDAAPPVDDPTLETVAREWLSRIIQRTEDIEEGEAYAAQMTAYARARHIWRTVRHAAPGVPYYVPHEFVTFVRERIGQSNAEIMRLFIDAHDHLHNDQGAEVDDRLCGRTNPRR